MDGLLASKALSCPQEIQLSPFMSQIKNVRQVQVTIMLQRENPLTKFVSIEKIGT